MNGTDSRRNLSAERGRRSTVDGPGPRKFRHSERDASPGRRTGAKRDLGKFRFRKPSRFAIFRDTSPAKRKCWTSCKSITEICFLSFGRYRARFISYQSRFRWCGRGVLRYFVICIFVCDLRALLSEVRFQNGEETEVSRAKALEKGRLHIMGTGQQYARTENHEKIHDSKTGTLHAVSNKKQHISTLSFTRAHFYCLFFETGIISCREKCEL